MADTIDNYPAEQHPSKGLYNYAENIIENDTMPVETKQQRLQEVGFYYNGKVKLNQNIFTRAENILKNDSLTDDQKKTRMINLGFSYKPLLQNTTSTIPASTSVTDTAKKFPWLWIIGGGALLFFLFKK